jgi:hypothetical protein
MKKASKLHPLVPPYLLKDKKSLGEGYLTF